VQIAEHIYSRPLPLFRGGIALVDTLFSIEAFFSFAMLPDFLATRIWLW
jgi:hypothetical protein